VFWGWAAVLGVSFLLYVAAPQSSPTVRIGGRTVVNVQASLTWAARLAFSRGASDDGGNPLTCYFAATTPEYIACGPVILDAELDSGWDNFQVSTTAVGGDVKVTVSDGVVLVGKLPTGTRMTDAGGRTRPVSAGQTLGAPVTNATLTASYGFLAVGFVWALASAVAAPGRRRRRGAARAVTAQAALGARAASSWAHLAVLPSLPPISPPHPVHLPPPPPRPSSGTTPGRPSGVEENRLFVDAEEPAVPGRVAAGADGIRIEEISHLERATGAGEEEHGHRWSGPAVLMLGPVMVVGWAVEPERRIVAELAAYLACHQERPRSAEEVQAALWPLTDAKADVSLDTVRQHLSRLRRALGESHLPDASKVGGYQLASTVSSDWFRFQALAEAARRVEAAQAVTIWRDALGLVRDAPFAGAAKGTFGWAWEELVVAAMETAIADIAHRMSRACLAAGNATQADWAASRGLLAVPSDETLLADRLEAAFSMGGHGHLERAWRDTRSILGDQADTGPLAEVHARLRNSG
jgi:hypothetical protein